MGRITAMWQARRGMRERASFVECRHVLESCSHRVSAARACGRYSVTGGRFGHLAGSLIL